MEITKNYVVIVGNSWNMLQNGLPDAHTWKQKRFAVRAKLTVTHLKCVKK